MGVSTKSRSAPWKVRTKSGSTLYQVRGSYKGFRLERSTGESDYSRASERASEMWSVHVKEVDSGVAAARANLGEDGQLIVVGASWLKFMASVGTSVDTIRGYSNNLNTLVVSFPNVTDVTTAKIVTYQKLRLGLVMRKTLMKELNVLRPILEHAQENGLISEVPSWPRPKKQVKGTPAGGTRKASPKVSTKEAKAILELLPKSFGRHSFPLRDFCIVLWETGLRPCLWYRATYPLNWKPKSKELNITLKIDKSRYVRVVPLSKECVEALTRVRLWARKLKRNPDSLFFPSLSGTVLLGVAFADELKNIATKVLGAERGPDFHPSCFRPARITHWLNQKVPKSHIMFMAGHKWSTTTDIYDQTDFDDVRGIFGSVGLGQAS